MTDLAVVEAAVAVVFPLKAEIHTGILAAAVTAGQAVYVVIASADYDLADAGVANQLAELRGIALESGGVGQAINILKRGHIAGFTLTQAHDDEIFLSDTAGALADAAGTVTVHAGRVIALTDKARTKVLFIDIPW
jgi:hypothetical protein